VIVLAAGIAIAVASYLSVRMAAAPNVILLLLLLLLLLLGFVLVVIVLLFGILGAVRFARTGSIREGIRLSAILTTIRTMGWLSYIILLVGFIIACVIFAVISAVLTAIPYVGWVLVLIVNPVFMIFAARYFSLVYDQGEPKPVPPVAPAAAAE
jgi:hypothetical protein